MATANVYAEELQNCLRENAHGIKSFKLGNHTSTEAEAHVTLLEEEEVTIYLDGRGFRAGAQPDAYGGCMKSDSGLGSRSGLKSCV